jgi:DNA polymerase III delta prime subunit
MIPAVIDAETPSPGEREVFRRLRDDPNTADWIVLHSFNLPRHKTQVRGEADFVVLAPALGMLCLEVKAHRRVARDSDGRWRLGGDPPVSRSPFKQAEDNMHSLVSALRQRRKAEADGIIAWSAVLFTHCEFRVPAVEWHDWEALDRADLHRRPLSALVAEVLGHARAELPYKAIEGAPTAQECQVIASALRPRFEVIQPPAQRRSEHENELRAYTEEQYAALDGMAHYDRVVFAGPAGTGKTLLALEAARRESAQGRRVGLICFNRLLGQWLEAEAAALGELVTASTLHRLMLGAAKLDVPENIPPRFFETELPERAAEALLECDKPPLFGALVVDEAQDILSDAYLDFLDLVCDGGLAAGRWTMFGDFERQALFGAADVSLDDFLDSRGDAHVFALRTNCRNTPRIARWVSMLAALDPAYNRIRRPDSGPPPRTRYYGDDPEQLEILASVLGELYESGFEGRDIVVISFKRGGAATRLREPPWRDRLRPYDTAGRGTFVRYATVQAFKGLEAPVIVLTDVDQLQGERARSIFYTAVTRATDRLYVLAEDNLADEMLDLVDRFDPEDEPDG